uniref:Transportin-3 n=1 Tax=Chrysotila carterae TaxID=13221 RepID=A0A7S4B9K5_CHRCT
MLAALPQEVVAEEAAIDGTVASRGELRARIPQVLALLQNCCQTSSAACVASLRALQAWLSLQAGTSLQMLLTTCPQLLAAALHALAAQESTLNEAAANALIELFSASNTQLSATCPSSLENASRLGAQLIQLAADLRLEESLERRDVDDRARHVCRVVAAFAERAVDIIAATDGPLLAIVTLMMRMLGADLAIAELTVDFWCSIQDTPLEQRNEQLRQPLYRNLYQMMIKQCTLPADFTTWEESDELQEEDFERFREQSAIEVLGTCMQLLHSEFVASLREGLGAPSWQQVEAAMFVVRGLHVDFKGVLSRGDEAGALPVAVAQEQKRDVQDLLGGIFGRLSEWRPEGQPQPLVVTAVRLCGAYGKWLQAEKPNLLLGCLWLTLQATELPFVAKHAAESFRALCVHGRRLLGDPVTVNQVLCALQPLLRSQDLDSELRVALTEGAARLIGAMRNASNAGQLLQVLVSDPCEALSLLLQQLSEAPSEEAQRALGAEIALRINFISSSIRFCDNFSKSNHPVPPVLQGCWPLLQAAGTRCRRPEVVQALCELYSKSMVTLGGLLEPLLPSMLQQIRELFCASPVVGCLTCITQALQMYGEKEGAVYDSLSDAVEKIIDVVCTWIRTAPDPEAEPELLTAFFEMCHRGLVFRPGLMLDLECMPRLFESAICCIAHQEFQHTRAALTFLCLFMSGTDAANQFRETAIHCLQQNGAQLVRQCLIGLVGASPINLVDHQVELLRVAAEACQGAVHGWLVDAFQSPGFSCGSLDPQGPAAAALVKLVARQPALSTSEFQSIVSDFSRTCRGKLAPNALDRYAGL